MQLITKTRIENQPIHVELAIAMIFCAVLTGNPAECNCHNSNGILCKYSVRDVGFVNVHSFGWQLTLAKPPQIADTDFQKLDQNVSAQLADSNVNHIWVAEDSLELKNRIQSLPQLNPASQKVSGILSNTNDQSFLFSDWSLQENSSNRLLSSLKQLVESPIRKQILESSCETLCVFVLIESNSVDKNNKAKSLLTLTVNRMKKQMWMLEKPTELPPAVIVVSQLEQVEDPWFVKTIGLTKNDQPHFAIMYGQGRRLGELIPLPQASVDKLVGRASVCGGDCECDLDRDWLYGHQLVHRWNKVHERLAESTLNFDPHAAYVKSEVATIVRKANRNSGAGQRIDLGPGLIIHDLEPLEKESVQRGKKDSAEKQEKNLPENNNGNRESEQNTQSTDNGDERDNENPVATNWFPATLILMLLAGVCVAIYWSMSRSH